MRVLMLIAALFDLIWRPIEVAWIRWQIEMTEREVLERSLDNSLSDAQAVNYMRLNNYYADRLAALTSRNLGNT